MNESRVGANNSAADEATLLERLDDEPDNFVIHKQLAYHYDMQGRYSDAVKHYVVYFKRCDHNDLKARNSMLWLITKRLKEILSSEDVPRSILLTYMSHSLEWVDGAEMPSLPYSLLLNYITKYVKDFGSDVPFEVAEAYLKFLEGWDLSLLRDEDFEPYRPEPEKEFTSLCQNVVSALYRSASVCEPRSRRVLAKRFPWCADFILKQIDRYPSEQWFPYFYGKLMIALGEPLKAREHYLKIAKSKGAQFWIWQGLAETFPDEPEKQRALLCRALTCKVSEDKFLARLHARLGDVLRALGMDDEAICEYIHEAEIRKRAGWPKKKRSPAFIEWARGKVSAKSNASLYKRYASEAEEVVFGDSDGVAAILSAKFMTKKQERVATITFVRKDGSLEEAIVSERLLGKAAASEIGSPITVWIERGAGRVKLRKAVMREGTLWDLYPKTVGSVSRRDETNGIVFVQLNDGGKGVRLNVAKLPMCKDFAVGDTVELVITSANGFTHVLFAAKR